MAGRLRRMWEALKRPPVRLSLGATLIIGAVFALAALGKLRVRDPRDQHEPVLHNACHEMNISFAEYQQSVHYKNATGVTATCSDCHIPHTR